MDRQVNFVLRPWRSTDADDVFFYANNKKIADNLRDGFPYPYTRDNAVGFIAAVSQDDDKHCCRAIEVQGQAIGSIGVFFKDDVYRKSAEIGYWLGEPFWGRGIMSRAIRQMAEDIFNRYDVVRIFAEPYAYNMGSRRALEKAGFQLEGVLRKSVYKNGKIYDSCIYALLKD